MKILAIETSCDETAIALAECSNKKFNLISNIVSSQVKLHKKYGGVYPFLARREHEKNLVPVLKKALKGFLIKGNSKNAREFLTREKILSKRLEVFLKNYKKPHIDAIAVTKGPGLAPCLWTGVNFSRALAHAWHLPLIPINHIEAHIFANFKKIEFPGLALIVSGGHTQLILIEKIGKYKIIGETRDDAAGECFDKIARILGLGYPGGPAIEKRAKQKTKKKVQLPRPMIYSKDYDFSFSGLKTAVLYKSKKNKLTNDYITAMARESQQAIIDVLIKKTIKASKDFKIKSIILGGGVSANKELQKQFRKKTKIIFADKKFCTDNAAMVAFTACLNPKSVDLKKVVAEPNLRL